MEKDRRFSGDWKLLDIMDENTWPLVGARVWTQRDDGFIAVMVRKPDDIMRFDAWPRAKGIPLGRIARWKIFDATAVREGWQDV